MTEATRSDDAGTPEVNWRMSAALEDVPRGNLEHAEVTNLAGAVRAWSALVPEHRLAATITPERPIVIDGVTHGRVNADAIAAPAQRLSPHHAM